jgi:small subunit ribosomal protein S1
MERAPSGTRPPHRVHVMTTPQKTVRRKDQPAEPVPGAAAEAGLPSAADSAPQPVAEPELAEAGAEGAQPESARAAREPFTTEGLEELASMDSAAFEAAMDEATAVTTGFEQGQEVTGAVVRLDGDHAFIDLGGKSEARIDVSELEAGEAELGASVTARILRIREDGVQLSRQVKGGGLDALEAAMAAGIPVEGRVESRNSGGYVVKLTGARGFCPVSQIDRFPGRELDRFVDQSLEFQVTEVRDREVVLSRRALQEVDAAAAQEKFWATTKRGALLEGVVTSVREYGAFVDLGGVEGLIHKSELSWGHDDKPDDVLKRWDPVKVKVLEVDKKRKRVALSMRLPETSPWRAVGQDFVADGEYEGKIVRMEDYGAFVELSPGLAGLCRIGNISWDRIAHPSQVLELGQTVQVKVLEVDTKRRRLDLGIRQLTPDPLQVLADKYPAGEEVEGVVQRVERNGISLLVDDAIVAWMGARDVELPPGVLLQQRIRRGTRMKARVVELDRQRRQLRLSQTADSDNAAVEARREIKRQAKQTKSLGTFADILGGLKLDD